MWRAWYCPVACKPCVWLWCFFFKHLKKHPDAPHPYQCPNQQNNQKKSNTQKTTTKPPSYFRSKNVNSVLWQEQKMAHQLFALTN